LLSNLCADRVEVLVDGAPIRRRDLLIEAKLRGCLRAYIEVPFAELNIQDAEGEFWCEYLGRRWRLVPIAD
jgi:hypothetical protein